LFGFILVLSVLAPLPLYSLMVNARKFGEWRFLPLGIMMFSLQAGFGMCTPTTTVWIQRFAVGIERAAVNGYTNCFAAFLRFLAPTLASSLLSVGLHSGTPSGRFLPIIFLAFLIVLALWMAVPVLPSAAPAPVEESGSPANANAMDTEQVSEGADGKSKRVQRSRTQVSLMGTLCPPPADAESSFINDVPPTEQELEEAEMSAMESLPPLEII